MRNVTDSFKAALKRSHTFAVHADLLLAGVAQNLAIEINSGSVTLDRTREIRGSCDLTIKGVGLIPTDAFSPVTPFGAELQLFRGINLSTGPELVSLGIFGIQDVTTDEQGGTLQISGLDRAQRVKDADFEATVVIPKGTNYATAIQTVIGGGVPGILYLFATTTAVTPVLVFDADTEGGRWAAAQQMATSIGMDLYFDADGRCVMQPVPDPTADPVANLYDGPDGVLVTASKAWSRADSYNAVIAYSSNPTSSGAIPRAIVRDNDPTSPTYYFGPFGKKPRRYSSPLITSQTQAVNAAAGLLRQVLGVAQSLDLSVVPNPALEPGDVVAVRRQKLAIDEVNVLDSLTIGLDSSGAMTAGVRARQIAA